jgi:non-ribosomal peptide synthetase component F
MYEVSYSGRVIDWLRDLVARNRPHAADLIAVIRELDRRLRIYPQFGQPLRDLSVRRAQLWVATVPPLVVQYIVVEGDEVGVGRKVLVARPPTILAGSGIV